MSRVVEVRIPERSRGRYTFSRYGSPSYSHVDRVLSTPRSPCNVDTLGTEKERGVTADTEIPSGRRGSYMPTYVALRQTGGVKVAEKETAMPVRYAKIRRQR